MDNPDKLSYFNSLPWLDLPGVPPTLWPQLLKAAGPCRIALVGGAVRDWLLHRQHLDPWRGLVDLDLVIADAALAGGVAGATRPERSSPAWRVVEQLANTAGAPTVREARPHGQYGTVELELEWPSELHPGLDGSTAGAPQGSTRLLLDVASARAETYPIPGENPVVRYGSLVDDLARRDLTINAMAFDLATGTLLDPHGGQADLAARQLRFLHPSSLRDDPTRLVRAARYAARLGFQLAPESLAQALGTLQAWPWPWRGGDPPAQAPAALGTRLRRELELLVEGDHWCVALEDLQQWGGLLLLAPDLQADRHWALRLRWGARIGLSRLVTLIAAAEDPLAVAERLQVPHRQHQMLREFVELRCRLAEELPGEGRDGRTPWHWCQLLEGPGHTPEAVALALACRVGPRRPLLRWWLRWRHLRPERCAQELMDAGVPRGPELGAQLRRSRRDRLERERL
jgi:poly(A) polymerase